MGLAAYLRAGWAAGQAPEWFTPYSLRHTCASIMAPQGVPVTTAAAVLGQDPAMFLRVYSHLYPGDMRGAAAALDTFRTRRSSAPTPQRSCSRFARDPLAVHRRPGPTPVRAPTAERAAGVTDPLGAAAGRLAGRDRGLPPPAA